MGLVDHWLPGQAWVYLPEESAAGARLRCERITAGTRLLLVAMVEEALTPARLFTVHGATGTIIQRFEDVMGLEAGLDMTNGTGHVERGNPPSGVVVAGSDPDADPASVQVEAPAAVSAGEPRAPSRGNILHANPYVPGSPIRFTLESEAAARIEILDATGRRVRVLRDGRLDRGSHAVRWDGRDDRGATAPSGVYFVKLLASDAGEGAQKLLLLRD
jgi:hypothetical protein